MQLQAAAAGSSRDPAHSGAAPPSPAAAAESPASLAACARRGWPAPLPLLGRRRRGPRRGPAPASAAGATPHPALPAAPSRPAACRLCAAGAEVRGRGGSLACMLVLGSGCGWQHRIQHHGCTAGSGRPAATGQRQPPAAGGRWQQASASHRQRAAHPALGRRAWACRRRLARSTPLPGSTASAGCARPCPGPAPTAAKGARGHFGSSGAAARSWARHAPDGRGSGCWPATRAALAPAGVCGSGIHASRGQRQQGGAPGTAALVW